MATQPGINSANRGRVQLGIVGGIPAKPYPCSPVKRRIIIFTLFLECVKFQALVELAVISIFFFFFFFFQAFLTGLSLNKLLARLLAYSADIRAISTLSLQSARVLISIC